MKEFLLIFRADYSLPSTTDQMQEATQLWMDWMKEIVDAGKLVGRNRLTNDGRVIKGDGVVTNGPYTEIKESLGGYALIRCESYEEATAFARKCPILGVNGGSVEVRDVLVMG